MLYRNHPDVPPNFVSNIYSGLWLKLPSMYAIISVLLLPKAHVIFYNGLFVYRKPHRDKNSGDVFLVFCKVGKIINGNIGHVDSLTDSSEYCMVQVYFSSASLDTNFAHI